MFRIECEHKTYVGVESYNMIQFELSALCYMQTITVTFSFLHQCFTNTDIQVFIKSFIQLSFNFPHQSRSRQV